MLVAVPAAIALSVGLLSVAASIGAYGSAYTGDPLTIFGTTLAYNLPVLGMMGLGGLLFAVADALALLIGLRSIIVTALLAIVASIPALLYSAFASPEQFSATNATVHLPVLFALLLGSLAAATTRSATTTHS